MSADTLQLKRDRLVDLLKSWRRVAVAFSGGVDSAVVAQAAQIGLGPAAVAVTAVSPSLASGELEEAQALARQMRIRHVVLQTHEFDVAGYVQNAGNRCYFCKSELYLHVLAQRAELNVDVICNGANLDDLGDHRPGMQAAQEQGIRSPLIECGLTKSDVRQLARSWGLPIWDKPASPCLSSRIAYGINVTPERVARIDAAELFLKNLLGVRELRVRLEAQELARIEVPLVAIPEVAAYAATISQRLKELGFRTITLDLEGFRSGSLNASLPMIQLQASLLSPG